MSIVEYSVRNSVAYLTLNRSEKLNAIISQMRIEMANHLENALADDDVRVIVVGNTGRAFCAGQDVKEIKDDTITEHQRSEEYIRIFELLRTSPKPTIARIGGYCTGAGMILAMMFDLRIAGESLQMGMTEINLGMPVTLYNPLLRSVVGDAPLRRIVLYSDYIGGEEALRYNAVTEVVPDDRLEVRTDEVAARLASHSPAAVARTKQGWAEDSEGWFGEMIEAVRGGRERWDPIWKD